MKKQFASRIAATFTSGLSRCLLAAAFGVMMFSASAHAADAIDDLRAFLRDTKTVRADFVQTTFSKKGTEGEEVRGQLLLSRPGKFRWATEKPYPQQIVSDGNRVWFYDPDLSQVIVRTNEQALGGTPAALLAGDDAVEKSFELAPLPESQGLQWLQARPRNKEAGFTEIRIGFLHGKLSALELYDTFGQKIITRFRNVDNNPALDAADFTFTPPKGADVIGENSGTKSR